MNPDMESEGDGTETNTEQNVSSDQIIGYTSCKRSFLMLQYIIFMSSSFAEAERFLKGH